MGWSVVRIDFVQVKRLVETVVDVPGLGQRIREFRTNDSRSVAELCRLVGISRAYWYQLESEDLRSPVSESVVRRIEEVLGIDLDVNFD
jgi:transcriptional regulator with XRE-family HTH domain